jgi:hypothetical protein
MAEIYKATDAMAAEAQRGLDWRKEFNRGGTSIGVARANQLVNRENLSESTVKRMHSYFSRHEVDKQGQGYSPSEEGYPSAGRIAWALWGGDPGQSWARARVASMSNKSMDDADYAIEEIRENMEDSMDKLHEAIEQLFSHLK